MRKKLLCGSYLLLVVLTLLIASPAQDTQRVEAFGGYSFTYKSPTIVENLNFNGWNASSTVFVNRWLGVTADFSGSHASHTVPIFCTPYGCVYDKGSFSTYSYLFGPHIVYRRSRYAPFAETLFGVYRPGSTISPLNPGDCQPLPSCFQMAGYHTSSYNFEMALGGGLDIALSHGVSIRPVDVDYVLQGVPTYFFRVGGGNNNTFRYSGGITFRLGQHLGSSR
jgi:hypothetical protein